VCVCVCVCLCRTGRIPLEREFDYQMAS